MCSFNDSLSLCLPTRNHPALSHVSANPVMAFPTAACGRVRKKRRPPAAVENTPVRFIAVRVASVRFVLLPCCGVDPVWLACMPVPIA
jgi:hypothetical protein